MIVDELYEWYVGQERVLREAKVQYELKPPISLPGTPGTYSLAEQFRLPGREMAVFCWNAGHLEIHLGLHDFSQIVCKYHEVATGQEAAEIVSKYFEHFIAGVLDF